MAGHAPAAVEADDARTALYRRLDYFPTPPWAARAGAELIRSLDPDARTVWEPACGEGHMAAPLAESFDVFASDIHPFGFGDVANFLDDREFAPPSHADAADWIVTNPPFNAAARFLAVGLRTARRGVALLLRLSFLEGAARYPLFYGAAPLSVCAVFAERVPMTLGRWDPKAASATAYAWFLWRKGETGASPRLAGIPPGTRQRLTRPNDAGRFGWRSDASLLDRMVAAGPDEEEDHHGGANDMVAEAAE